MWRLKALVSLLTPWLYFDQLFSFYDHTAFTDQGMYGCFSILVWKEIILFTIAWQSDAEEFNGINVCIICVNEDRNMCEMPSMTLRFYTDHSKAAIKLVQWMESLVRRFPEKRFQLVGDKKNPSFNQLVKERMSHRELKLPFVDVKNLYISSGVFEQEVVAEIKELHDWNEHIEDRRRAFYRALEATMLQERIRKNSHNIDKKKD